MRSNESKESKALPANIKAVLFDYDGVIADTMADNCRAWQRAFNDFGVNITDEEYYMLEGMSPAAIAKELGARKGLSETAIGQIPVKKAEYYRKDNAFRVYPEIPDIVRELKRRGIKVGLVSGAARHRIEEMTPHELLSLFDIVVSADDVSLAKPDPEPYQKALEFMHLTSSET